MSIEKYISEVQTVQYNQELVYNKLSNLKNLEQLFDPEKLAKLKERMPNAPDMKIEAFQATEDECSFRIQPIGQVGVKIIEKEEFKTIKFTGNETVPFQFNFWIQLLPADIDACHLKLTLHADLNPMIKMVAGNYLKEGINKIAEALTRVPFSEI